MDTEAVTVQLITFQLGHEFYAIDIMKVKEIHSPLPVRPIPNSSPYLEGVFSLRSDVIPLLNLHRQFDLAPLQLSEEEKLLSGFIIVKVGGMLVGLIIDKVLKVVSYAHEQVQHPPQILSGINGEYVAGVIEDQGAYLTLIDVDSLFSVEELARLTAENGANAPPPA